MSFIKDAKVLYSFAQAEGRVIKLHKLIQLEQESLQRPDFFLNRHAKIKSSIARYYDELKEAENLLNEMM